MEMKIQVPFQQLLTLVKTLTPAQKAKLRQELDNEQKNITKENDFIDFLLNGPVYTDSDLQMIDENRKSIAQWRTKN